MTRILVTGGRGFLGRNLVAHLSERKDCELLVFDQEDTAEQLQNWANRADLIFHLAGTNRPENASEFETGNVGLTEQLCQYLKDGGCSPKVVFSSSIQAELENPYGVSKRKAEEVLRQFAAGSGAGLRIYRLKNLFGKWCRPNYNSVTATFCHNIANDLPIAISDAARELELSYVDDVVSAFLGEIAGTPTFGEAGAEIPSYRITLGDLAGRIQAFHEMRSTLLLPDFADSFNRALYATYLSYVQPETRLNELKIRSDVRGGLAEFIKQKHFGQIFVSRTKPGMTRGNHYHHTRTEKFFVVEGNGVIRMRPIEGNEVKEYFVRGSDYQVIDIPPGFAHSITNVGSSEMVTIFWSSEVFDPAHPDTYYLAVDMEQRGKCLSVEPA